MVSSLQNATGKGALGKRSGQTQGRKFDARRESVSLTRYFQQMASGEHPSTKTLV